MLQEQLTTMSPADIITIEGFNPRKVFLDADMQKLKSSAQKHGIIQSIVVRPHPELDNKYHLVAGERRWRVASELSIDVPVIIKQLSDVEAHAIANEENNSRVSTSAAAEAYSARAVLDACDGDKEQAAIDLDWSISKLNKRLLLLHCCNDVLLALEAKQIKIGHAESLSIVPDKTQIKALARIISDNISVADLQNMLSQRALSLESAIFDTTDCNACVHNSTPQSDLFETNIGGGKCGNPDCFQEKRQAQIAILKTNAEQDYPRVYLDSESDPKKYVNLMATGEAGIGKKQLQACRGDCKDFCAIMSTKSGEEGVIIGQDVCRNLKCYNTMRDAYQGTLSKTSTKPKTAAKSKKTKSSATKKVIDATTAGTPPKVVEFVKHELLNIAKEHVTSSPTMVKIHSLLALFSELNISNDALKDILGITLSCHDDYKNIKALFPLDDEKLDSAIEYLTQLHCVEDQNLGGDVAILECLDIDLKEHFIINEAFLSKHTKAGIKLLMAQCGFEEWFVTQHDEAAYKKLYAGTNPKTIDSILNAGFDFKGFLPKSLTDILNKYAPDTTT